jgi:hypothetical protein
VRQIERRFHEPLPEPGSPMRFGDRDRTKQCDIAVCFQGCAPDDGRVVAGNKRSRKMVADSFAGKLDSRQ